MSSSHPVAGGGVHGNAIISRYGITHARAIVHSTVGYDWEQHGGPVFSQPRKGRRVAAVADVATPLGTVTVYSAHLENACGSLKWCFVLVCLVIAFAGINARLEQICELLDDARDSPHPQIIAGDFNTLAHGLARLNPYLCNDWLRSVSLTCMLRTLMMSHRTNAASALSASRSHSTGRPTCGLTLS